MTIRRSRPDDADALLALWRRSVAATHGFLSCGDIDALAPIVRDHVFGALEVWVWEQDGAAAGFIALDDIAVEALFLDPAWFRRGGGQQLLAHARAIKGRPLRVDVNEANPGALAFYRVCGFEVVGRSELDGQGRPFPLLHLREKSEA